MPIEALIIVELAMTEILIEKEEIKRNINLKEIIDHLIQIL